MNGAGATALALRFSLGVGGSLGLGWLRFRGDVLVPGTVPFQCVTIGTLTAALFALVRGRLARRALLLVAGYGVLQAGIGLNHPWPRPLTSLFSNTLAAAGLWLVAIIFARLADRGMRAGKFLLSGPLVGGVYLAVTPLTTWGMFSGPTAVTPLFVNLWMGMLIGTGVGVGIELAELWPGLFRTGAPGVARPAATREPGS